MLIIGTFEHSIELEEALSVMEHSGILRNSILVVPMDADPKSSIHNLGRARDRFYKGIEVGIACATASCVIGTSIGFKLKWGPVFWALIATFIGFTVGFGLYMLINKGNYRNLPKIIPEITVIVQCPKEMSAQVMDIMWRYRVLTVGQIQEIP